MIDGNTKTIEADGKIAKGIYVVTESRVVKRNVQKLKIQFNKTFPDNILQNRITKIEKWAFLATMVADKFIQYIFMPSARQEDFNHFSQQIEDIKLKEMLTDTFNMRKVTMSNLDVFTNLKKGKN